MNDELITMLREQRGTVPMDIPVEQIISRGRVVRARRRIPGVAAAIGTAAAAALAVSVAVPGSHPASHPATSQPASGQPTASGPASAPGVQLAAWTVARQPDGNIQITFREAANAAGLQRTLRADGITANVTFTGQVNPACRAATGPVGDVLAGSGFAGNPKEAYETQDALVINPSALPHGDGLYISTSGTPGAAGNFKLDVWLVHASPQCTGS